MDGNKFLADTNIFIYLTQGIKPVVDFLQDKELLLSIISSMELLSWPLLSKSEITTIEKMLEQCEIIPLTDDIAKKAVQIRRQSKVELPDAIIAATALVHDLPLLTADKDFKKVSVDVPIILINI